MTMKNLSTSRWKSVNLDLVVRFPWVTCGPSFGKVYRAGEQSILPGYIAVELARGDVRLVRSDDVEIVSDNR